jgi:acetylornithine deacetylase/succinyl-diaminopimelate desuccinylase-like protein
LKKLVATPSVLGATEGIEQLVASEVGRAQGAEVELLRVGGLGNDVMARSFKGQEFPTILLNGHLDTVDVCKGWTRDPFKPEAEGNRLYGLGSADMKAGVAIAMRAFETLAERDDVNAIFAGTIDEEGDSAGAFALLDAGISADLCLIPEPSSGRLMMGCRGRVVIEADARGSSAHGSRPGDGVNAIVEAGKLAAALDTLPLAEHEKLGKGSFCALEILGGTRTLSVPDSCWLKIDRHYVLGETREGMLAQVRDAAARLGSRASFDISLWKARPTPFLEPYLTEDSGLARVFTESIGADFVYGKSVGDYNAFARTIPTVVYGPHGEHWHGADEFVDLGSVRSCLDGYRRFFKALPCP